MVKNLTKEQTMEIVEAAIVELISAHRMEFDSLVAKHKERFKNDGA